MGLDLAHLIVLELKFLSMQIKILDPFKVVIIDMLLKGLVLGMVEQLYKLMLVEVEDSLEQVVMVVKVAMQVVMAAVVEVELLHLVLNMLEQQ